MTEGVWTVTELCQHLKLLLDSDDYLRTCVVAGEISNASLYPSGHLYLTLKDSGSQIAGVMFQSEAKRLRFKPEEGLNVLAFGRVTIYPGRSQYQIIIQELKPEGVGELFIAFQQMKEKLEKEGLFDLSRKKPIPFFPKVVGIVTSLKGAVLHDMATIIERRNPAVRVIVAPSPVQGTDARPRLISALRALENLPAVEVIVMARGGGSPEELWTFNDEELARAIAACGKPVVSAVGHETDYTICDLVADFRAPTPSAAAELIAPDRENLWDQLVHLYERLRNALSARLHREENMLASLANRPVFRLPFERIEREGQTLDLVARRLDSAFKHLVIMREAGLSAWSQKLDALSPKAVLERGYAIVTRKDKIIKTAQEAQTAGKVGLVFQDGRVDAVVEKAARSLPAQETFQW